MKEWDEVDEDKPQEDKRGEKLGYTQTFEKAIVRSPREWGAVGHNIP